MLSDDRIPSTSVACVAAYPDINIVAYMGTKTEFSSPEAAVASLEDWTKNAEALLVPFRLSAEQLGVDHPSKHNLGGRIHNGFLEELAAV
jgi:hypothetical protein